MGLAPARESILVYSSERRYCLLFFSRLGVSMPVVGDFVMTPTPSRNRKYSRMADIFRALAIPVNSFLASAERYSTTSIFSTSAGVRIDTLLAWRDEIHGRIS